jgi:hypothetical protein
MWWAILFVVLALIVGLVIGILTAKLGPFFLPDEKPWKLEEMRVSTMHFLGRVEAPNTPVSQVKEMMLKGFPYTPKRENPAAHQFVIHKHLYEMRPGLENLATPIVTVVSGGYRQFQGWG